MVTSPPYHVGKDYDADTTFEDYLDLLEAVFRETYRVLQPGGRAVVNVANLGRRPYVPLSHLVTARMMKVGFFMRAEIIWRKAKGAGGNCAWGSWRSPANPVVRDVHEYPCASRRVDSIESSKASDDRGRRVSRGHDLGLGHRAGVGEASRPSRPVPGGTASPFH